MAAHSAMDRVRPDRPPQRRNQGESRRVGHPRRKAAEEPAEDQHLDGGRRSANERGRYRQRHAEDGHHFAPVAVAERTEPEDRAGQAQRIGHGHEVELGLCRIEVGADGRQRDIRHRQGQVGDGRDDDEGAKDGFCLGGGAGSITGLGGDSGSGHDFLLTMKI